MREPTFRPVVPKGATLMQNSIVLLPSEYAALYARALAAEEQLAGERLGRRTAEGARDAALLRCQELEAEIAELNGFIQKRIDPHAI